MSRKDFEGLALYLRNAASSGMLSIEFRLMISGAIDGLNSLKAARTALSLKEQRIVELDAKVRALESPEQADTVPVSREALKAVAVSLEAISSLTQDTDLLWWQVEARKALSAARRLMDGGE